MNKCYNCVYYQRERYNEKDLCEYNRSAFGGFVIHIPRDKGVQCVNYKER
jgi:hypothetical protein